MAGAAAVLAERLDLAHRFLDHTAADLVAAVADADRGNALGLGKVGKMVGAGDLVGRARRSHDRVIDALGVVPDLLDEDHRRRLELLAERGAGLLAVAVAQRLVAGRGALAGRLEQPLHAYSEPPPLVRLLDCRP